VLGDERSDADGAEVVEEATVLVGKVVEVVGVVVEEGGEELFASFSVGGSGWWFFPGDGFHPKFSFGGFADTELAESLVEGFELVFSSEDDFVQLVDPLVGPVEVTVVVWWGHVEPDEG